MYEISHKVINFIDKTMKTWRVELTAGGRDLAETKIQRGIFQGGALSSSQFIIAMMPISTYSENSQRDTNLVDRRKRLII